MALMLQSHTWEEFFRDQTRGKEWKHYITTSGVLVQQQSDHGQVYEAPGIIRMGQSRQPGASLKSFITS